MSSTVAPHINFWRKQKTPEPVFEEPAHWLCLSRGVSRARSRLPGAWGQSWQWGGWGDSARAAFHTSNTLCVSTAQGKDAPWGMGPCTIESRGDFCPCGIAFSAFAVCECYRPLVGNVWPFPFHLYQMSQFVGSVKLKFF